MQNMRSYKYDAVRRYREGSVEYANGDKHGRVPSCQPSERTCVGSCRTWPLCVIGMIQCSAGTDHFVTTGVPDNLDRYVPEFDEDEARAKLAGFHREQLIDMLIDSYKLRRAMSNAADEKTAANPNGRIRAVKPARYARRPTADDLRSTIDDQHN